MFKYKTELNQIQKEYLDLLHGFDPLTVNEEFYIHAVSLIDKCSLFWASKHLEIIEILEDLTKSEKCFWLSGAIYLGIDDNGHYEFGAFGDRNILNDPVIRMKSFFYNHGRVVPDKLKEYFCDAIQDTVQVLTDYSDCFTVMPIDLLIEDDYEENQKIGEKVYWDLLSSALHSDIRSIVSLKEKHPTLQQLENALGDNAKRFVFSDLHDVELTLNDRVEKWFTENNKMVSFHLNNDIDKFFFASISQVQQSLDILFKCLRFNLYPFIRFEITIQYFLLIAGTLSEDELLREHIEYALISYWFTNYVITDSIEALDFTEYYKRCKSASFSERFRDAIFSGQTSFSSVNVKDAISTMTEIFIDGFQNM